MVKSTHTETAAAAPAPAAPQQYYYAPPPPKVAKHPGMELALAIAAVLASAWLFVDALAGAIALFGNRTPGFDSLTGLLFSHLSGYTGVVLVAIASVLFAGAAFWLFRRLNAALESDDYKATLHIGAGVAVVKTLVLGATTVAAGLAPLLAIGANKDVGPAYLYDFLPLAVGTGLFVFVAWSLLKLVDKQKVASLLSIVLLIATSVVFVLAFVAVIVNANTKNSSVDSTNSPSNSSRSSSSRSASDCYDDYEDHGSLSRYRSCLNEVYGSN